MKRKFIITIAFETGQKFTEVFECKKQAKAYCEVIGQTYRSQKLKVDLQVYCDNSSMKESFIKPALF